MLSSICVAACHAGHSLLLARHLLKRHLHAEIAARHHDRVGDVDDLVEPLQRLRFFDLRHDARAALNELARLGHVVRPLDEGKRDPVHFRRERRVQVAAILFRQRAGAQDRVGQADALAIGKLPPRDHFRHRAARPFLRHLQAHAAVVEQDCMARLKRFEDFRMRQVDPLPVAGLRVVVEHEGLALRDLHRAVLEAPEPELRPLQVGKNADRPVMPVFDVADDGDEVAQPLVRGMAHVDAEDVRTGAVQLVDRFGCVR